MKKIKAIMFLGLVVALLVIGFSPISEAASIEGKREKATIQKQNVEEQDTEEIACSSEGENIIENEKEQNFISTQNMSSATENECTEGASFSRIINLLSNFSDIIQNIWWLITLVVAIFVLMNSLFSIRKKANKYTGEQVKKLIQDGKYIPGVFVELNNSKEVLRYFVYGKKWRKRLIKNFNYVYDNSYGEILKKACDNQNVCFRLNRMASTKKILETVNSAYEFHNNFRNSGIEFKQDYKESQILFEIIQYPYNEILGSLLKYSKVANGKYLILTGSAGNGKTNLLCSISELLVNLKQTTIFLNAREIEGDILDFIFDELGLPDLYKKHKEIYLYLVNLLLNSGILLSKKLVFHEGTIARNEKEVVYFVFDEMRDYCLARQILLNNISAYNVDGESVIEKLKQLKATGASCTEGVIHYCYVFFKTDELVSKLGQTEKMCNSILDLYRIPEVVFL